MMSINGVPWKVSTGTSTTTDNSDGRNRQSCANVRSTSAGSSQSMSSEETIKEMTTGQSDFSAPFLFSDLTLEVEGKTLHAHRAVLSLWSPVFRAMFQTECQETENKRLLLPEDKHQDVVSMLKHMYTPGGRDIDSSQALTLLPLFHRYQVDVLVKKCETRLIYNLSDNTAAEYLQFADVYQLENLRRSALERCAKLDAAMLEHDIQELTVSSEVQLEVYKRRVLFLENVVRDIQGSLTRSVAHMEAKMEKVPENHCTTHSTPLSTIDMGFPCPSCVDHFKTHLKELCRRALNRPSVVIMKN